MLISPKQGPKIVGAVLHRVGILGLKVLNKVMGQVPPPPLFRPAGLLVSHESTSHGSESCDFYYQYLQLYTYTQCLFLFSVPARPMMAETNCQFIHGFC